MVFLFKAEFFYFQIPLAKSMLNSMAIVCQDIVTLENKERSSEDLVEIKFSFHLNLQLEFINIVSGILAQPCNDYYH